MSMETPLNRLFPPGPARPSTDQNSKKWTQSKPTKAGPRAALNDISNQAATSHPLVAKRDRSRDRYSRYPFDQPLTKMKVVEGGSNSNNVEALNTELACWVGNQNLNNGKRCLHLWS